MKWRQDGAACWSEQQARRVIPVEAEELPDHIFASTHVPLQLRPIAPKTLAAVSASSMGEDDLLDRVRATTGTDVIPILGASGAGKSHLVRWLRGELRRDPIPATTVVFIPKHRTSLYGVVRRVLDVFEGEPFVAPFRKRLEHAQDSSVSDEALRMQLRDVIAHGLQHRMEATETSGPEEAQMHEWLAKELPKLLRDPLFEQTYLAPDAALGRLVEEKRHGRAGDDAVEEAFEFTARDVSVSVDDAGRASSAAQEVANQLAGQSGIDDESAGPLLRLAVRMINDQRESALKAVFGIGGDDLKTLFFDIRRALAGRSRLILLVEDFSMFQGLQGGLIDAVTLHSTDESRPDDAEPLCDLTTVVAVTTSYFEKHIPDTLKTRSSLAFEVSRSQEASADRFVATYLAAIRAGEDELRLAFEEGRDATSVCGICEVRDRCHDNAAFGQVGGEGLYPFNRTALDRAIAHVTPDGFNARETLNQILLPVLTDDRPDLVGGDFPTPAFGQRFGASDVALPVADAAALQRADDGARRQLLAKMYSPQPSRTDLSPAIHDAFKLPPLGLQSDGEEERAPAAAASGPLANDQPARLTPSLVAAIEQWPTKGLVRDRTAVRKLIHRAVVKRLPFEDGAAKESLWATAQDKSRSKLAAPNFVPGDVVIDDDLLTSGGHVRLDVRGSDSDVVEAVQTLAWLEEGEIRTLPDITGRLGRLEVILDRWAADMADQLGAWDRLDEDLTHLVRCLDLCAAFLGRHKSKMSVDERLEAIFSSGSPATRTHDPGGLTSTVETTARSLREMLERRTTFAQGTGAPSMVDLPSLRTALRRRSEVDPARVSREIARAAEPIHGLDGAGRRSLLGRIDEIAQEERATLPDLDLIGNDDPREITRSLVGVLRKSPVETVLAARVHDAVDRMDPESLDHVRMAQTRFQAWDTLSTVERVALVGGRWHAAADQVADFVTTSLEVLEKAAPGRVGELGRDEVAMVSQEWTHALHRTDSMLKGR